MHKRFYGFKAVDCSRKTNQILLYLSYQSMGSQDKIAIFKMSLLPDCAILQRCATRKLPAADCSKRVNATVIELLHLVGGCGCTPFSVWQPDLMMR